jgi:hypothetical protein
MKRQALLRINIHVLKHELRMPKDTEILAVHVDPRSPDIILLKVEHPSLLPVQQGLVLPEVQLIMHAPEVLKKESEFH